MFDKPLAAAPHMSATLTDLVAEPDGLQQLVSLADTVLRSLDKLAQGPATSPEMVFIVDDDGVITHANRPAARALGCDPAELAGQRLSQLLPGWKIRTGGRLTLRAKGRPPLAVAITVSALAGQHDARVIVARDVSREDIRTRGLFEQVQRLASAVKRATESTRRRHANTARRLLAARLAAVGELARGVAHELNNPISSVLTYSVLMEERMGQLGPPVVAQLDGFPRFLESMIQAAHRCAHVVDSLLTFSRDNQPPMMAPVALSEVIRSALDLQQQLLQRRQIALTRDVDDSLTVRGDLPQLQRAFACLLSNAANAVTSPGEISIRAQVDDNATVAVDVVDSGEGIPEAIQDRIFEPFFTYPPSQSRLGLGLSVVHGIIASHGGKVTVHSAPGRGTRVRINLPLLPQPT